MTLLIFATLGHQPSSGFPVRLENLEKWEGIFQSGKSQGILNRLEKSGKSQGNHTKYWKTQGISEKFYLFFFSVNYVLFVKMDEVFS